MAKRSTGAILAALNIDRTQKTALHRQVYHEIRRVILSRTIAPGDRLPSTRTLALELGISRRTVVDAYLQLYAEGYVDGRIGAGTYVATAVPDDAIDTPLPAQPREVTTTAPPRFSDRFEAQQQHAASALINRERRPIGGSAFVFGLPAVDHFPFDIWRRIAAKAVRQLPMEARGYQDPAGHLPLREAVSAYLSTARGVRCAPDQVIIVNGSQQALSLIAHMLLNPGDAVWVEEPGYFGAKGAMLGAGATLAPVPVDDEGMNIAAGRRLWPDAKLVVVTPSHQMPLGATMSLARRMALLDWAAESRTWIVEDDYDSEFRYGSRPLAALQGLDTAGRVIYTGTFSKVMFPALRLGYIVVPQQLRDAAIVSRLFMDGYSPLMEQMILAAFLRDGYFERHIRRMRTLYQERQGVLLSSARHELSGIARVSPCDGGMHLVAMLETGIDDREAARMAERAGVRCIPLSPNYLGDAKRSGLLLGYAAVTPEEIADGVRKLRKALGG